jgi:H+/Cl- antiporter ClcA
LRGRQQLSTPEQAATQLVSRSYLRLLVFAAIIGVPISVIAYFFLAAVSKLQHWLYDTFPGQIGFHGVPAWWPVPILLIGGLLVAATIRYLPGTGGHSPADGFKPAGVVPASHIPGIALAALATLGFGAVLGPEAPLIALGGGIAAWAVSRAKTPDPSRTAIVASAAGSFAAISTLLGNPLVGAFLLMEASGIAGATLELVLIPGLLASGIGALVFTGLDDWTGFGTFSLALPGLPHFTRPDIAELGWAILVGLAAAIVAAGIRRLALRVRTPAERVILIGTPLAGLLVAGLAITFQQVTGHTTADVLFSGQNELPTLIAQRASYGLAALLLMLACKGLGYSLSLATFRGGPVFPSLFLGGAAGLALSHLPGLPFVPAMAIGMGAMMTAMLRLPMTSALLAVILVSSAGTDVTPLVIVAVVVSYVASAHLDRIGTGNEKPRAAAPAQDGGGGLPRRVVPGLAAGNQAGRAGRAPAATSVRLDRYHVAENWLHDPPRRLDRVLAREQITFAVQRGSDQPVVWPHLLRPGRPVEVQFAYLRRHIRTGLLADDRDADLLIGIDANTQCVCPCVCA